MSIAENRKHVARLRRKRAQYNMCKGGEVAIGKITTTPKQCNCWMCSNHRKTDGKSIQEIKQEQHYVDQYESNSWGNNPASSNIKMLGESKV